MNKFLLKLAFGFTVIISVTLSTYFIFIPNKAVALSGSDFKPGRIIDDSVFYNSRALTAGQVQTFLNSKMPSCDTNGTKSQSYYYNSSTGKTSWSYFSGGIYTTTSRATFGQRYATWYNAHPYTGYITNESLAPYVCLNGYTQDTPSVGAYSGICSSLSAGSKETAANIISNVSAACGVSPKVLIVLVQKEQGLVTDDWPWEYEYREATGYGCPDGGNCNANYYGFFNQVYNAAWQFKEYSANPTNFSYIAGQNNSILYHPDPSSCGSETVYIQNQATAGLYNYTPYVPDAAALKNVSSTNMGGSGDSCSSYGNRNFWWYYNYWFGSTYTPTFQASYAGQSSYPTIVQGQNASAFVRYQNTGNMPWYDDVSAPQYRTYPVHLAVTNPINSSSIFGGSWPAANRPAGTFAHVYESDGQTLASNQHVAQPGQIIEFDFTLSTSGSTPTGTSSLYVQPVLEGSSMWNMGGVAWWKVTVTS